MRLLGLFGRRVFCREKNLACIGGGLVEGGLFGYS